MVSTFGHLDLYLCSLEVTDGDYGGLSPRSALYQRNASSGWTGQGTVVFEGERPSFPWFPFSSPPFRGLG